MTYKNNYHTKKQLVETLESRGVFVDDITILDNVNYSHLMYVFGRHFIDFETIEGPIYKTGTKLSQIYNLFLKNIESSAIFFEFFHLVEHKLKSAVAHWVAAIDPLWYADINNYKDYTLNSTQKTNEEKSIFHKNLMELETKKRNQYDPKYYKSGKLPMWLLIDEMAFGQITMLIKYVDQPQKDKIYSECQIAPNNFKLLLEIKNYRNLLFHGNALTGSIGKGKEQSLLINILKYMKLNYPTIFQKLDNFIETMEWDEIGITKLELFNILKIAKI